MSEPIAKWPHDTVERDKTVAETGEGTGWIQWKGTDACIDLHCKCGAHGHIDSMFLYFYKCNACGETFAVGQTVRLYSLTPEVAADHGDTAKSDEELIA